MKYISLCENHLFTKVYKTGARSRAPHVTVYVLADRHAGLLKKRNPLHQKINRVGISVPKKGLGAVGRNRVKRVLREAYRRLENEYEVKKGKLIVISAGSSALKLKTPEVYTELVAAAQKAGLL